MQRPKKFRIGKKSGTVQIKQTALSLLPLENLSANESVRVEEAGKKSQSLSISNKKLFQKSSSKIIYQNKQKPTIRNNQRKPLFPHLSLHKYVNHLRALFSHIYIPHIYRIFNARLFRLGVLCLFVALLVIITTINIFYINSGFNEYKIGVLLHYSDPNVHVKLASIFFENNDFEHAQQELLIAQKLSPNNTNIESQLQLISLLLLKPREIASELTKWKNITIEKPNYRDGYFRLAVLYYQVFEKGLAKKNVEKTLELDPNFQPAKQFLELLSH